MNKEDYKVYSDKMRKSIDAVSADFASVRAGRANAAVLDRISVDYYGSPTPIQQIAAIASPDPRQLVITPWDGTALKPIERAIQESDLGINPQNDGKSIRLNFNSDILIRQNVGPTSAATRWRPSRKSRRPARSPRMI